MGAARGEKDLTLLSETSTTSLVFESKRFDSPPYNGYTLFRPVFDRWYADKAREAGATLLTGCLAKGLLADGGAVKGVRIARDNGDIRAPVTVACDGVLSLLNEGRAREAARPSEMALGIKALFRLTEEEINERFNLEPAPGSLAGVPRLHRGVRAGGFIYTQTETLSVGLVLHLVRSRRAGSPRTGPLQRFCALDEVSRILKGGRLVEYSAHVLPEGDYRLVPRLSTDGLLVAGDAAALCYTNGLNQEGMNLAMTSGFLAAETASMPSARATFPRTTGPLRRPAQGELRALRHEDLRKAADLLHNDRLFSVYPNLVERSWSRYSGPMEDRERTSARSPGKQPGRHCLSRSFWRMSSRGAVRSYDHRRDLRIGKL